MNGKSMLCVLSERLSAHTSIEPLKLGKPITSHQPITTHAIAILQKLIPWQITWVLGFAFVVMVMLSVAKL